MFLLSSILNIAYFFPVVLRSFFRRSPQFSRMDEASFLMLIPLLVTALLSVILGLAPNAFVDLLRLTRMSVASILG